MLGSDQLDSKMYIVVEILTKNKKSVLIVPYQV